MIGNVQDFLDAGTAFSLVGIFHLLMAVIAGSHVVLYKQNEAAAFSWLGIIVLAPVVGAILYWLFGINRIRRRARAELPDYTVREADSARDNRLSMMDAPESWRSLMRVGRGVHHTHYLKGNQLEPFINGDAAYPEMIKAIEQAQESVILSSYIFEYDSVGKLFVEALSEAHERGVQVRVMIDGLGVGYGFSLVKADRMLRRRGVRTARFLSTWSTTGTRFINLRNHRKILSVDGRVAFIGGLNIREGNLAEAALSAADDSSVTSTIQTIDESCDDADAALPPGTGDLKDSGQQTPPVALQALGLQTAILDALALVRPRRHLTQDVHFRVQGPVIDQINAVFAADWQFAAREDLQLPEWDGSHAGPVTVRALVDGPDDNYQKLQMTILGAIQVAQFDISIVTPYFLPDRTVLSALQMAALRGVEVNLCVPRENNLRVVGWAMRANRRKWLRSGIRLYESAGPFDHSKLLVVDDYWSLIGSSNWDARSLELNFEINLECYDRELNSRIRGMIADKIARSSLTTRCSDRHLLLRLRNNFFRLFSPYL